MQKYQGYKKLKESMRILAIILGVLSIVSLIQHISEVGINPIFVDFISYYRLIVYQLFGFLGQLLTFIFPPALMDIWSISFIGAGAYVRTPNIEKSRLLRNFDTQTFPKHWKFILFILMGFSFSGVAILLSAFQPQTYTDEMSIEPNDLSRGALKNTLLIIIGVFLFFILNAYAPSL